MSLSVSKIESLFRMNGFVSRQYLAVDGDCMYIEVIDVKSSETFLVYIPSKYTVKVKGRGVINMTYIEVEEQDDYADVDDVDVEKQYDRVTMELSPDTKNIGKLASSLEQGYRKPITLRDMQVENMKKTKDMRRQMNRLSFCVQHIPYKLGMFYKSFACIIRRDNSIDSFLLAGVNQLSRKLVATTDLEMIVEKSTNISRDISRVRDGIHSVLGKNHRVHVQSLEKMLEERAGIAAYSERCQQLIDQYDFNIARFEDLSKRLLNGYEETTEQLRQLRNEQGVLTGERSRAMAKHENDIKQISATRQAVTQTLIELKNKREGMLLTIDKIMFDSSVMFDVISKNFMDLKELCR